MEQNPRVKPIFRSEVTESLGNPRTTREFYTKYEYCVLLATRTQQLAEGAKPLASLDGLRTSDPRFLEMLARREIEERKLPFLVRRLFPNGTSEYWSTQDLEIMW